MGLTGGTTGGPTTFSVSQWSLESRSTPAAQEERLTAREWSGSGAAYKLTMASQAEEDFDDLEEELLGNVDLPQAKASHDCGEDTSSKT